MRLNEEEAAKYIGVSRRIMQIWRREKPRIRYRLIGTRAFYETEDLDRYMEGVVVEPEEAK